MPGVPTSKGCEACRRRKKGCDLIQPTCGRCTKLGIKCVNNGTGRLKFVDETKNWSLQKPRSGNPSRRSKYSSSKSESTDSSPEPPSDLQVTALSRSAVLSQAIAAFWDAYTPRASGYASTVPKEDVSTRWLHAAIGQAHTDRGLNDALMALAMSRASRITKNQDARRDALMFYGSCVQRVRRAIASGDRLHDDALLASVMLLAMFEVHEGTRKRDSAWAAHINGASRLINARGAQSFSTEFGKTLYLAHLRDELVYGIGSRGKSRHGVDAASFKPSETDMADLDIRLVSILSTLPTIVEAADNIRTLCSITLIRDATVALAHACHQTMDALEAFDESLQWSQDALLYWEEPSALYAALPASSPERIMPTRIAFSSFPTACLQFTTWTSLLLMHSTLWLTYMWLRGQRPEAAAAMDGVVPAFLPPDQVAVCDELAVKLVKSMEYFVQPEAGLLGAQQIVYPISIVLGYLTFWEKPERLWFPVIVRRLHELNVGIEGFLADTFKGTELKMIRPLEESELRAKKKADVFNRLTTQYESQQT